MSDNNASAALIYNALRASHNYSRRHDAVLDISNIKRLGVARALGVLVCRTMRRARR